MTRLPLADERLTLARFNVIASRLAATSTGCWEWTGAKDRHGYGRAGFGPRRFGVGLVHRMVYEAMVGTVPDGLELDHLCRNSSCANPVHLEPVTHTENVRRGAIADVNATRAAAITHCPQGHAYDDANTYVHPTRGTRSCIRCMREANRRWRARRSAA